MRRLNVPPLLVLLLIGAATPGRAAAQEAPPAPGTELEVTGSAQFSLPSDRASIAIAVEARGEDARGAGASNAETMQRVISALRESRAPGLRIETFGYALEPEYVYPPGGGEPAIRGYVARNHLRVRTDSIGGVGGLIDRALEAGANRVTGLSFEASQVEEARLRVLEEAVRQARSQAETMARALGRRLGAPIEIRGGAAPPPTPWMPVGRSMMLMEAAASTPIEGAESSVSASVTIRWQVEGGESGNGT